MPRYFSLEEANKLLYEIQPLIEEIMTIHHRILEQHPEAWPAIERAAGNGGSRAASLLVPDFDRLRELVHVLSDQGVLVKDMGIGLLDFPSMREGREVYLCWKYGEEKISFWHDLDAGYGGRQPLR